ncbi:MAG: DUF1289 domain-containing protein [Rhizobiales bacterium PAR1]|nr:MAG: DUF1289 domain-containing protein [Rhizobiales bacterium PAR1]
MVTGNASPSDTSSLIDPASPCTKVCVIDSVTGWCLGCGRTGSEIAGWIGMTTRERLALKAQLPTRLAAMAQAKS